MAERITDKLVRDLAPPPSGNRRIYDTDIKGFGVRVTAAGAKAFVLNYYAHGRERRYTIGSYPDWTVAAARTKAAALKREVDNGGDPLEVRQTDRAAPTMPDLFERYRSDHLPHKAPRSAADDESMWRNIILPFFGHRKIADVTPADCDQLHREASARGVFRGNRVIEVLRKAMNLSIRWGWRTDNPASGVRRNREQPRERYLAPDEIAALVAALDAHRERVSATAILLMLLTGCRRGEALNARWSEFDLAGSEWAIPSARTKQRKAHRVPLAAVTLAMMRELQSAAKSEFVFPGRAGGPLTDVKRTWQTVRRVAGLNEVRLHDLRHTFASVLRLRGESLQTVGELLGHSQLQTTARYSHLPDNPRRQVVEGMAAAVRGGGR